MGLMDTLNQCISAGHEMTKAIAIAQFNDDSPEARKITRRWRIGEAADLVGVSSQAIRDAEKAGRLPHPDMETRGRVEQRVGYTIEQINHMRDVFGTRLRRAEDAFSAGDWVLLLTKVVFTKPPFLFTWLRTWP